jgi:glycosyltransferase involved in cell wall biosynthesis
MYGAWMLGVPFSFTGHAVDLFRDRCALKDKVKRADLIVCISRFHRDLYRELGATDARLHIVYCGIDLSAIPFRPKPRGEGPARILSLGRLVEKKGFADLIDACAILKERGVDSRCVIAGDGPLEKELQARVERLGLRQHVEVTGKPVLQESLADFFAGGDIYAQPCVWSADNDVDGTPRTLMEAMASGLCAVSTRLTGIPDIVEDGDSGLLTEPGDVKALADALERLIRDPDYAHRLALGGRRLMEQRFDISRCLAPLAGLFGGRRRAGAGTGVTA